MEVTKDQAIVDSRAKLVSSKCFLHMLKMFDCNPLDTHFNARPGRYLWPKQLDLLNIQTGHFLKPINDFDKTLLQIFVIIWLLVVPKNDGEIPEKDNVVQVQQVRKSYFSGLGLDDDWLDKIRLDLPGLIFPANLNWPCPINLY